MNETFYPRLCGGTFLCLLLQFRKTRTAVRGSYYGMSDGMSEPDVLVDLIRVACPSYKPPHASTMRNNTSRYKCCQLGTGAYLPFFDSYFQDSFDYEIREDYAQPEERMRQFYLKYFEPLPNDRTHRMISALMDLVSMDESINLVERLFVRHGGLVYEKHELLTAREIDVPPFLLGLWHYIITQRVNNSIGIETYETWFAPPSQQGAKRKFISDIGQRRAEYMKRCQLNEERINSAQAVPAEENPCHRHRTGYDYSEYLKRAAEKYGALKTLLYTDEPRPFYDFYVCNEVIKYNSDRPWLDESFEGRTLSDPTIATLMKNYGRHIILYGSGGIGKSMMMRHLLLDAVKNYDQNGRVPFFIPLKDYDKEDLPLLDYIHDRLAGLCPMTDAELEAALGCGEIVLLFDGLDEIKSRYVADFERQLNDFMDQFPSCGIIISSRPSSSFISYSSFIVVELLPFYKEQALELIDKLEFRPDAPEIKEKFRERLDKTYFDTHEEFASTPLLLTIMLMTFEQYAEIPAKMHLFYREAFYTLAQRHDASKGAYRRELKTGLTADQISDYFSEFCARTYYAEKIHFTWYEFEYYFLTLNIVNRQPREKVTARNFLDDLTNSLCLLYLDGEHYTFTHRSFQEYFCALYFSRQKDRTLGSIGALFEKSDFMSYGFVFPMLYDLIPEKADEYILRPQLSNLIEDCEQSDGFWTYLKREHPRITYASEHSPLLLCTTNEPKSFFVQFLAETLQCETPDAITGRPDMESFLIDFLGDRREHSMDGISCTMEETNEGSGDPERHFTMIINVETALEHREQYERLFSELTADDFPLMIEYKTVLEYYHADDDRPAFHGDDFFDQF